MAGQSLAAARAPWRAWLESVIGRLFAADAPPPPRVRAGPPPATPARGAQVFGARGWERVLDAAREELGALSIFAADPRGLVIASRGSLRPEHVEELAAGLLGAFARSAQFGEGGARAELLRLGLGRLCVTGYFPAGALLVGIVARDVPLDAEGLERLRRRFDVLLEAARVETGGGRRPRFFEDGGE